MHLDFRIRAVLAFSTIGILPTLGFAAPPTVALDHLRESFGGKLLDNTGSIAYRLAMADGANAVVSDARYRLDLTERRIQRSDVLRPGVQSWWDESGGWRLDDGAVLSLNSESSASLHEHLAYNFLALLKDPATRAQWHGADRIRLEPAGVDTFDVLLDPTTGRIRNNDFGDGAEIAQRDYVSVDGVWWPRDFDVKRADASVQAGHFSELAVAAQASIESVDAPKSTVLDPHRVATAGAVLVGAGTVATPMQEYNLGTDAGGKLLVFARSEAKFRNARIHVAERSTNGWSTPEPVPFSDPRYSDTDPWLTSDGKTLYFVSNRPAKPDDAIGHSTDIWRVSRNAKGWGEPEHLGAVLNSPGMELGPELHDGWLYFNSSRAGGPASLAIYRARVDGNGFGPAEALPAPFNAGKQQGDFTLSPDGSMALFWSIRDEHPRDGEIYAVRRTASGWGNAVRLPAPFNSPRFDYTPSFSPDGSVLWLASDRKPGWHADNAPTLVLNGLSNLYAVSRAELDTAMK